MKNSERYNFNIIVMESIVNICYPLNISDISSYRNSYFYACLHAETNLFSHPVLKPQSTFLENIFLATITKSEKLFCINPPAANIYDNKKYDTWLNRKQ